MEEIWIQVADAERSVELGEVLRRVLAQTRDADEFHIVVPRELLAQRYRTQRTFSVVVGSVAALALLVGGIGIMNIMLTSVVERTREIGVRRTAGARKRDVTMQFLIETLLMTVGGGIAGIATGAMVSIGDFGVCRMGDAHFCNRGIAWLRRFFPCRPGVRFVSRDEGGGSYSPLMRCGTSDFMANLNLQSQEMKAPRSCTRRSTAAIPSPWTLAPSRVSCRATWQDQLNEEELEQIGDLLEGGEFIEYVGPGSDGIIAQVVLRDIDAGHPRRRPKEAAERWLRLLG